MLLAVARNQLNVHQHHALWQAVAAQPAFDSGSQMTMNLEKGRVGKK